MIEGAALSLWRDLREAFSQMASSQLRSCVEIRRLGYGTSEAIGVSDTKAASGRHAEGRCSRRGDLRRGSPHSFRLGGNLWPGRHDGRHAETCPPRRPGTSAPRLGNERSVAPRRQRQGRSVVQPLSQWRGHSPATLAGKGRHRIRRQEPLGFGTKSLAGLNWKLRLGARKLRAMRAMFLRGQSFIDRARADRRPRRWSPRHRNRQPPCVPGSGSVLPTTGGAVWVSAARLSPGWVLFRQTAVLPARAAPPEATGP